MPVWFGTPDPLSDELIVHCTHSCCIQTRDQANARISHASLRSIRSSFPHHRIVLCYDLPSLAVSVPRFSASSETVNRQDRADRPGLGTESVDRVSTGIGSGPHSHVSAPRPPRNESIVPMASPSTVAAPVLHPTPPSSESPTTLEEEGEGPGAPPTPPNYTKSHSVSLENTPRPLAYLAASSSVSSSSAASSSPASSSPASSSAASSSAVSCIPSVYPTVFFFDLEADQKKTIHPTRQIAIRSLDGSVSWLRNVKNDFGVVWTELINIVEGQNAGEKESFGGPRGQSPLQRGQSPLLVCHNLARFDRKILRLEAAHWNLQLPTHWRFVDSLPLIRTWLRAVHPNQTVKCDLTTLTKSLLKSEIAETNESLIRFWNGRPLRTGSKERSRAHQADFDCLVLRCVFVLAMGSFASRTLIKRTSHPTLDQLEEHICESIRLHLKCHAEWTLEEMVSHWVHGFALNM